MQHKTQVPTLTVTRALVTVYIVQAVTFAQQDEREEESTVTGSRSTA